jgi:hypothetical protein
MAFPATGTIEFHYWAGGPDNDGPGLTMNPRTFKRLPAKYWHVLRPFIFKDFDHVSSRLQLVSGAF